MLRKTQKSYSTLLNLLKKSYEVNSQPCHGSNNVKLKYTRETSDWKVSF